MFGITRISSYYSDKSKRTNVALSCTNNETYHISEKQFIAAGFDLSLKALYVGSLFTPTFYQKGDKLLNGSIVTDNGKILKEFSITLTPQAGMALVMGREMMKQFAAPVQQSTSAKALEPAVEVTESEEVEEVVPA